MIRRFNYTGRKRIPANLVSVRVSETTPATFEASWSLETLDLPANASVCIEAYTSGSQRIQRFPYGTVGSPEPPADPTLDTSDGSGAAFNIVVVDTTGSDRLLLATGRNVQPRGSSDGDGSSALRSLLPVNPRDLGPEIWNLAFEHDRPWLEVNNEVPGIMDMIREDPMFFGLVYPEVIRRVLHRILVVDRYDECDADLENWRTQWLRWGIHWHPDGSRPSASLDGTTQEEQTSWIDSVVHNFCTRNEIRHRLVEALGARGRAA